MPIQNRRFSQIAVLGAGVMGAQIAAHFANAGLAVLLYDLKSDGAANAIAQRALKALIKMNPPPLASPSIAIKIVACNFDDDLEKLRQCDLVIEVVVERLDIKHQLYQKITPHLSSHSILASNTSGIPIAMLASGLTADLQSRFCGLHFFNPPRYMHLLEMIPHTNTDPKVLDALESFLTTDLGKGIIRTQDTPGFIANRLGVFATIATINHMERYNLSPEEVDELTGIFIGHPKSATFRTADLVGLDTFAHVINFLKQSTQNDPWNEHFVVPKIMQYCIDKGALGQKVKHGIYKKQGKDILVVDTETGDYRERKVKIDPEVHGILLQRDWGEKFSQIRQCEHPQAKFITSLFADCFYYAAYHLKDIADNARDMDLAMHWGYGWKLGLFETWTHFGWHEMIEWMQANQQDLIADGALPDWVKHCQNGVHTPQGSYSAKANIYIPESTSEVYRRQLNRERLVSDSQQEKTVLYENEGLVCWHTGDHIGIVSFKTKMHTVNNFVLDGILDVIDLAEKELKALVFWQAKDPFCAGADLSMVVERATEDEYDVVQRVVEQFQQVTMRIKHSNVPVVAAVSGLVLGGGCEITIHADRVVAAFESYIGLVELGVGLIPAGSGCKEMALRAYHQTKGADVLPYLADYFENIAMAKVSASAVQAREMGYLREADIIVMHNKELLYVAKQQANVLYESNYRPPSVDPLLCAGSSVAATLKGKVMNMLAGGYISEYDALLANELAMVMCGGGLPAGTQCSQEWLLSQEVKVFLERLHDEKTLERIGYMLMTGKPLRN